jgi:hypothetical protein
LFFNGSFQSLLSIFYFSLGVNIVLDQSRLPSEELLTGGD